MKRTASPLNLLFTSLFRLFMIGFLSVSVVGCFGDGGDEDLEDDIELSEEESPAELDDEGGEELGSLAGSEVLDPSAADGLIGDSATGEEALIPAESFNTEELAASGDASLVPGGEEVAQDSTHHSGESFTYHIKRGDWLSKIAIQVYGDMSKWPEIARANRKITNPDLIYAGDTLMIPIINAQAEEFAKSYQAQHHSGAAVTPEASENSQANHHPAQQTYEVQAGDSLSSIAATLLGSAAQWKALLEHNNQIERPELLQVGMQLNVPHV
ncbi:MAG: LysM peptidoglycan-binding domain-containing protein [Zetaproteobacteria bacterium]|nr:LysM peptidoglycan-binding domain-containing protein [Zetaproteobacteria bacterium]